MDKEDNTVLVYSYSRADAIADGVLVDVSELAAEAGFRFPMAVTSTVWQGCVAVPAECEGVQDEAGRLWDILNVLRYSIYRERDQNPIYFTTAMQTGPRSHNEVRLKAVCGPGDNHEPVLTVMYPHED